MSRDRDLAHRVRVGEALRNDRRRGSVRSSRSRSSTHRGEFLFEFCAMRGERVR
jgi:hypothetical protein